jgi:hypothetical protein
LFLAEFAASLRGERNGPLRQKLQRVITDTKFEDPASVASLRKRLTELLRGQPEDLRLVREAVATAYVTAPSDPAGVALATLSATPFDFDRQTLARLQTLPRHEVVAELRALMGPRITAVSPDATVGISDNLYTECGGLPAGETSQCANGKLRVPTDLLDAYYDILAADVQNPGKTGLLAAASAGVFDPPDFIRRPGERLSFVVGAPLR